MSAGPPGANGTINRMGFDGKGWANDATAENVVSATSAMEAQRRTRRETRFMC
jgi:hypothetical protein